MVDCKVSYTISYTIDLFANILYNRIGEVTVYIVQPTARCASKVLINEVHVI